MDPSPRIFKGQGSDIKQDFPKKITAWMTFLKTDKLLVNKMNKMYNHTLGSKASFKVLTSLRFLGYDASYDIFHALEKEMATHSSVLAWRIPGTGEPGGLPSLGSHRVGHD